MSQTPTATQHCAVVVGVGASQGIGAAVCRRIAREGLLVYVAGRTASKLTQVVAEISAAGGQAAPYVLDATQPEQVTALFAQIAAQQQTIDLVVHNVGSNMPSRFLTTTQHFFDQMWRLTFFSGFLVSQQAIQSMLPQQQGTLIFTGASASLRGKPYFAAFTTGKASQRAYAHGLAQTFTAQGLHIAHVVVDGMVDGDRINQFGYGLGRVIRLVRGGLGGSLNVDAIAESYWQIHQQRQPLWTHELVLRPFREKF